MKIILVTGVNGFVGHHLVKELHAQGYKVVGVGREPQAFPDIKKLLAKYVVCDLTNKEDVSQLPLKDITAVINLAGIVPVGASFADPEGYKKINVSVLTVLGEELIAQGLKPRVIAISTGTVYKSQQQLPLTEDSSLADQGSPYSLSKIAMEQAIPALRAKGLECIIARPFNHIGPGQGPGFLVPDLYAKIMLSKNTGQPIKVGNLKTKRDYSDVRDVVKAYVILATKPDLKHQVYNISSGQSISGEEVLHVMQQACGITGTLQTEQDPALIRQNDPPDLYGSYERLKSETGWQPEIPFKQTIADFISKV